MLPRLAALKPEKSWVFVTFMLFCVRIRATRLYVIYICCLKHLDVLYIEALVIYFLFHLLRCSVSFSFAWANLSWESSIPQVACWLRGKEERSYPSGGVGYLRLARLFHLAARAPHEFARGLGWVVLSVFEAWFFAKKWDHFWEGGAPRSSPRGRLGFRPFCQCGIWSRH
jgi:hypothetical protein